MSNKRNPKTDPGGTLVYQIRVKGHLDSQWIDWFGGLTITLEENGVTLLTGPVADQAALFGLLKKVRDLGMPLLSINSVEPGPSTTLPPSGRLRETGQAEASEVNETYPYRSKKEIKNEYDHRKSPEDKQN